MKTRTSLALLLTLGLAVPAASRQELPEPGLRRLAPGTPGRVRARLRFDGERFVARNGDYTVLEEPGSRRAEDASGAHPRGLPGTLQAKALCVDATTSNGFFVAGTTGSEWMDWAAKECASTGVVTRIATAYATSARPLAESNGTGGSLGVSFYEGTQGFCSRGELATTARGNEARFSFFELPACPASATCPAFLVTALLPDNDPICWSDGKIGWGYTFVDDDGSGAAQTGPVLVEYAVSTAWADMFDLWSRPDEFGSCAGSFFFGGCTLPTTFGVPNPCAGFYLQVWEEDCSGPGTQSAHVVAPNGFRLVPGLGPDIGRPFSMRQTPLTALSLMSASLHDLTSFLAAGFPAAFLAGGTRLHLLFGPAYVEFAPVFTAGAALDWGFAFPKHAGLCGAELAAQGFDITLGPIEIRAVNAITMTVGG